MAALFDIEALRSDEGVWGDWGWWKDPRSRAHILNSGPHNIDLCRWWLGDDIVSVVGPLRDVPRGEPEREHKDGDVGVCRRSDGQFLVIKGLSLAGVLTARTSGSG
ncbi:MAG: hypothetical protein CM1200mP2_17380 [Planctomycetaceae bacterium]|nr:MAG: hypothetical protein CM1200mP2_17380 [Planctomycetaceae bacterium]